MRRLPTTTEGVNVPSAGDYQRSWAARPSEQHTAAKVMRALRAASCALSGRKMSGMSCCGSESPDAPGLPVPATRQHKGEQLLFEHRARH